MTADQAADLARPDMMAAIEKLRGRGLSKMAAYSALASNIGKSPDWVRGLVGRQTRVKVYLHDYFNLRQYIDRLERINNDTEFRIQKIREELNAAAQSDPRGASVHPHASHGDGSEGEAPL